MKAWAIAWKDLRSSLRSAFAIVMMFVAPLLLTGIFSLAFGRGDGEATTIPSVRVVVANLDRPEPTSGGYVVGSAMLEMLEAPDLQQLLQISEADSAAAARAAVDAGRADLAIILPADLTRAVMAPGATAVVTVYHDPALTVGPNLIMGLLEGYADGFSGVKIGVEVYRQQRAEEGLPDDPASERAIVQRLVEWASTAGQTDGETGLQVRAPVRGSAQATSAASMLSITLIGMAIFFVFFTGAATAESLIEEDEQHTLARLFTTPTPHSRILGGKLLSVGVTVLVQLVVLLAAGRVFFAVRWGRLLPAALMTLGLLVAASGCGVFVMSWIKSTRQSGAVMGGVLTLTGMLGGLMTIGVQNLPAGYRTLNLFTPHGWALRGWTQVLSGAEVSGVWVYALGCIIWGAVTFAIGLVRFRRRYA